MPPTPGTPVGAWARLAGVLSQRCPVCLQGPVFRSLLGMHKRCPVCATQYEREHGYFLNAMFIAYAAGFLILVPSALLLAWRNVSAGLFSAVIILETILVWPLIFRYSRVIWMHIDQMLDPRLPPADAADDPSQTEPAPVEPPRASG
jgi:uncharacterized protein (DUF983 family)